MSYTKFKPLAKKLGINSRTLSIINEDCPEVCATIASMANEGFTMLGSGAFGVVLGRSDVDFVFKFSSRKKEDGWFHYAKWIIEEKVHKNNPHFPDVQGLYEYNDCYVAQIERLSIYDYETHNHQISTAQTSARHGSKVKDWEKYLVQSDTPEELQYAAFTIGALFTDKFSLDMHSGNFMFRSSTQHIVVTDPISYSKV